MGKINVIGVKGGQALTTWAKSLSKQYEEGMKKHRPPLYEILWDEHPNGLADKVNERLQAGWRTCGGVSVKSETYTYGDDNEVATDVVYMQAVRRWRKK